MCEYLSHNYKKIIPGEVRIDILEQCAISTSVEKKYFSLFLFLYIFQNRDESSIFEKLESREASYENIQDQYDKNNIRIGKEKILYRLGSYDEKCDSCNRDKLEHRYE